MNKLKRQQIMFWMLLLVAAATILLFQMGMLPTGGLAVYDTNRYIIDVAVIFLTIGLIPLAIKRFGKSMERVQGADDETFLNTYRRESEIRLALLFVVMMLNIGLYYGSGNENMVYCALAGFVAYIFSFPSNKAIQRAEG